MNCLRRQILMFLNHYALIFGKMFGRTLKQRKMGGAVKIKMVWTYLGEIVGNGLVFSANKKMDYSEHA